MSGIPFTAGSEASGGWPKHRGPRPPFKPGPADAKAARKAEKRAERERRKQSAEPSSLTSRVMSSVKSSFLGRLQSSSPEQPEEEEEEEKKKKGEEEMEKDSRAQRNRDGIPIIEITPAEGKGT